MLPKHESSIGHDYFTFGAMKGEYFSEAALEETYHRAQVNLLRHQLEHRNIRLRLQLLELQKELSRIKQDELLDMIHSTRKD
jgi:hypothetical protein